MNNIGDLITDPAQLIFIDEAARNKKNLTWKIGWSLIGKCAHSVSALFVAKDSLFSLPL